MDSRDDGQTNFDPVAESQARHECRFEPVKLFNSIVYQCNCGKYKIKNLIVEVK
jgi:hypothetical protein